MLMPFELRVFQNPSLPRGASEVNAIVSVTAMASQEGPGGGEAVEVFLIDCSASMTDPPRKLAAAREATIRAIERLPDGTWFAVVMGRRTARCIYPEPSWERSLPPTRLVQASDLTREEARVAVGRLRAEGGTAIATWLELARQLFDSQPGAIHHALLLTDGRDEGESPQELEAELQQCLGRFECDCRGVGTDWDQRELRRISDALLGTTDIIVDPSQMGAEFEAIIQRRLDKRVRSLTLQLLTPVGGGVKFLKQVSPEVVDLTGMSTWMQPDGAANQWHAVVVPDPVRPILSLYPTGSWSPGEQRDYHLCLAVTAQEVGEENEVRAARVSLLADGRDAGQAAVRAVWTDNADLTTRIDRSVAHYSGQEELADVIQAGLEARRAGDVDDATRRLGRAVQLAHLSGNEGTRRLLESVVEVDDAERGTVRLKTGVTKGDEMVLDTRSRRTVRLRTREEER
jgi:hypothetical protein